MHSAHAIHTHVLQKYTHPARPCLSSSRHMVSTLSTHNADAIYTQVNIYIWTHIIHTKNTFMYPCAPCILQTQICASAHKVRVSYIWECTSTHEAHIKPTRASTDSAHIGHTLADSAYAKHTLVHLDAHTLVYLHLVTNQAYSCESTG